MIERLYKWLNKEKGECVCVGIADEACAHVPGNYFRIIIANIFTKLGDVLSAPKTVLTWLMASIGAPIFFISLLVPIRESGSMLPQVFLSQLLRNQHMRKWWWVLGSLMQSGSLLLIILTTTLFKAATAGLAVVILVGIFSLGRALCSLTSKDVIGKTIPKGRRGKLGGYSSSLSGALVLISGLLLLVYPIEGATETTLKIMIAAAAAAWIISTLSFASVQEFKSEEGLKKQKKSFSFISLLKNDRVLQKFILARGLLISSALLTPFIVLLSQQNIGNDLYLLGLFILAGGIASIISGPIWGHMADISSKGVMVRAAGIVAVLSIFLLVVIIANGALINQFWLYPVIFFIISVAHDGIRLGRKTYIVDIAEGEERTQYVATSNTAIGLLLLLVGGFSAWIGSMSLVFAIALLTVMVVLGIFFSWKLEEVG